MELSLSIAVANSDGFGTRLCSSGLRDNTRTECANRCNTCTNSYGLQCRTDRAANLYLNRAPSARTHNSHQTYANRGYRITHAIVFHLLLCVPKDTLTQPLAGYFYGRTGHCVTCLRDAHSTHVYLCSNSGTSRS